jgi:hypothetical protein
MGWRDMLTDPAMHAAGRKGNTMRNPFKSSRTLVLVVAALAMLAVAGVAFSQQGGPEGLDPRLDVAQKATATDRGVTLSVSEAAFSGTGTYLRLTATFVDGRTGIIRVIIPGSAVGPYSLALSNPAGEVGLVPGRPETVRFAPVDPGIPPAVHLTALEIVTGDGKSEVLGGIWELPLNAPSDLRARLRLEPLAGSPVESNGVTIAVEGATRSSTETLVTVRVTPGSLKHIGIPVMNAGGETHQGGLVAEDEGGALLTFAFPAGGFGAESTIRLGPWVRPGAELSGSTEIDIAAVLARHPGATGYENPMPVLAADLRRRAGAAPVPNSIRRGDLCGGSDRPGQNCLVLELDGARDLSGEQPKFRATVDAKRVVDAEVRLVGYNTNPAGVVHGGRTEVALWYKSLDELKGVLTLVEESSAQELVRGEWAIMLNP